MKKLWSVMTIWFGFVMLFITILAYESKLPINTLPLAHADKIGHFILFGIFALLLHKLLNEKISYIFTRQIPTSIVLVSIYAIIDESLQVFSSVRTFDLVDLLMSILGIWTCVYTYILFKKRNWLTRERTITLLRELCNFVYKQTKASLFAGSFLALLVVSKYVHVPGIYRYDFLFIGAIVIQIVLLITKNETKDEAKNIFLFHIIGLVLELYKTHPAIGSWSYPEPGILKIGNVPLYGGFMYASIGSYIASAWKQLSIRLENPPLYTLSIFIGAMCYLNFFTNHFIYDVRYFLIVIIITMYWKTNVIFINTKQERRIPLILGFLGIAIFVWIAENIGTLVGAWKYPYQIHAWSVVSFQKISSWFLMVIISFIIVSYLKHYKQDVLKKQKESINLS